MRKVLLTIILALFLGGCSSQPVCPEGTVTFVADKSQFPEISPLQNAGETILIRNKEISFDQVIHGALCDDQWSGKVYIACDLTLLQTDGKPNFLDGCNLEIDPGTAVYVAAHNNAAYNNGCNSCHQSK